MRDRYRRDPGNCLSARRQLTCASTRPFGQASPHRADRARRAIRPVQGRLAPWARRRTGARTSRCRRSPPRYFDPAPRRISSMALSGALLLALNRVSSRVAVSRCGTSSGGGACGSSTRDRVWYGCSFGGSGRNSGTRRSDGLAPAARRTEILVGREFPQRSPPLVAPRGAAARRTRARSAHPPAARPLQSAAPCIRGTVAVPVYGVRVTAAERDAAANASA